ncbi:hypothetical protein ILYODFUR_028756 [Ilyodon furcidens]|uniref:Uncharacterized protein n=1 Tax=Ilyodon furcidens TaxID=33524 RepID=A0ABV0UJU2_9TELE
MSYTYLSPAPPGSCTWWWKKVSSRYQWEISMGSSLRIRKPQSKAEDSHPDSFLVPSLSEASSFRSQRD